MFVIAPREVSGYQFDMTRRPTLSDLTQWVECALPGEEGRARTVVMRARKAGIFTTGGRGRGAPMMVGTDFAAALLCVLYGGATTDVAEGVRDLWNLPVRLLTVDDPGRVKPVSWGPKDAVPDDVAAYFARYKLGLTHNRHPFDRPETLLGVLTCMFGDYSPHHHHEAADRITVQTCGERLAVVLEMAGKPPFGDDGQPLWFDEEAGPDYATVRVTFGDAIPAHGPAVVAERTLWGEALNRLSLLTPNLTKAEG